MMCNNICVYTSSLNHRAGILCQEGEYTLEEMECVHDVLHQYQMVGGLHNHHKYSLWHLIGNWYQ